MLVLDWFNCEVNTLCGQLTHSWLENQILNKSADDAIAVWESHQEWQALEQQFPNRVRKVLALEEQLEKGFSPAQLIDRLMPLSVLPDDIKDAIKDAVHNVYLGESRIADLKEPLRDAALALSEALARFRAAWGQPVTEGAKQEVKAKWWELYRCAERLRGVLDRLPRGIVLP